MNELKMFEKEELEKEIKINKFYYLIVIKIKKYENRFTRKEKTMYLSGLQGSMSKLIEDSVLFSNIGIAENIAGKIEKSTEENSDYICTCNVKKIDIDEAFNLNII